VSPRNVHKARGRMAKKYSGVAERYDTKWSFYVDATTRETVARLDLEPTDRVLDVGCGTGVLLERLSAANPGTQFAGVDAVPEMLAMAGQRLPSSIVLREGWAEQLPFAGEEFDVVVSCNMFHYIHEPFAALREMGRVLRPGGRIVITDWCDDYLACRVCDLYLRLFNRAHFKAYGEKECAGLLQEAGYVDVAVDRYKISWLWGLMTATGTKQETQDPF